MPEASSLLASLEWNGFLEHAVKEHPDEVCGFLFAKKPYTKDERWMVGIVKNATPDRKLGWIPDKKDMTECKKLAKTAHFTKIGNVHSHPCDTQSEFYARLKKHEDEKDKKLEEEIKAKMYELFVIEVVQPSDTDLRFANKFNDIVRGIVAVSKDGVEAMRFHNQFNGEIVLQVAKSYAMPTALLECEVTLVEQRAKRK